MNKEVRKYTNGEVTVVWKPIICTHSTLCWKGLIQVFNPKERPWIKMDGATTERIIEQVKKCPSGALSYYMNAAIDADKRPESVLAESSPVIKVEVTPNGPYIIKSEQLVIHANGKEEIRSGTVALCRCGASANKPYCDGSHRKNEFEG